MYVRAKPGSNLQSPAHQLIKHNNSTDINVNVGSKSTNHELSILYTVGGDILKVVN